MTETAKERKLCGFQPTGKAEDVPRPPKFKSTNTDKLEDHLLPYTKEMVQKIRDEKMQLVTADEFVKLHKESLTAIRENDKLQEQLNTAKKALTEIAENENVVYRDKLYRRFLSEIAQKALAAIGGKNE